VERPVQGFEVTHEQVTLLVQPSEQDWPDVDGQQRVQTSLKSRPKAPKNERAELELLLEAAKRCKSQGPDAKAEVLWTGTTASWPRKATRTSRFWR